MSSSKTQYMHMIVYYKNMPGGNAGQAMKQKPMHVSPSRVSTLSLHTGNDLDVLRLGKHIDGLECLQGKSLFR